MGHWTWHTSYFCEWLTGVVLISWFWFVFVVESVGGACWLAEISMCLGGWFLSLCVFYSFSFFLLSCCKVAFVLFSVVTIWLLIVLVSQLFINFIIFFFVIRILFSVVLLLFFVVRSRIKVLSSSILLFAVCKSFHRFIFSLAIGVIIFLLYFLLNLLSQLLFPFVPLGISLQNVPFHHLFYWTQILDYYTFLWLLLGLYHSWVFLVVC